MNKSMIIFTSILGMVLVGYIAILTGLYTAQRLLMYHPNTSLADPAQYNLPGISLQKLDTADGEQLIAWFAPASDAYPTILYFHGNAEHLGNRADKFRAFTDRGFGLLAVSYRGYGGSSGAPSEEGLYHDARAALAFLESKGIKATDTVFYGESLGSGVAVKLATEHAPKLLVLEAPYTSVADRAQEIYWYAPVRYLLKDIYNSLGRIKEVHAPLVIIHGEDDLTIPIHHGRALLAEANEPKTGIFLKAVGHTDFPVATLVDAVVAGIGTSGRQAQP
jgi:fermentation-respiration switch protein FrsA (DUF1100 family)